MLKTQYRTAILSLFFSILATLALTNTSGQTCNTWLKTTNKDDVVNIGDLDIPGDKITVEAIFNRIEPLGIDLSGGDLVSKHSGATDCNYLLRANRAEITTTNGFAVAPADCELELNRTYHSAFVYDGTSLKFYRNGFLMKSVPASGNLILNNWTTTIGDYAAGSSGLPENMQGYINEVRIWNVARTQQQIRDYMSTSLPSPTTQPGLQAYYVFNGLENKQGNPAWNGTIEYGAEINQTNPVCPNFVADSCGVMPNTNTLGGIINDYTPIISFDPCINTLHVENAAAYNVGDTVLLIQMKGAIIDTTNTSSFGAIENYNNSGNYEFNFIESKTGNTLILRNKLLKKYDTPFGKVQLIRVPYYENAIVSTNLTCLPWDGDVGGVLAFNVKNDLTLNANINVNYNGFRRKYPLLNTQVTCNETSYYYDAFTNQGAEKGEGIHSISEGKNYGRGAPSNGGGGGNGHNAGGGGGGNGGTGGNGGDQWESCDNIDEHIGGKGGKSLPNNATLNKLYMGGSGGMGQGNDKNDFPSGSGGGIIIISANSIKSNGHLISAMGEDAYPCVAGGCGDGMSGGGAGGTILLNIPTLKDQATIKLKGGDGADHVSANNFKHGPGGGGGGGVLAVTQSSISPLYDFDISGGKNGINTNHGNDSYGATPGTNGVLINAFPITLSSRLFKINIDSVKIKDNAIRCNHFDFEGLGYINNSPINSWKWIFGDNSNSNSQNTTHTYSVAGLYTVKLIVTDGEGCSDSASLQVNIKIPPTIAITSDTTICFNSSLQLNASGGTLYSWSPAVGLNDPNSPNPVATITEDTRYKVIVTGPDNCFSEDSIYVAVRPYPQFTASTDKTICQGTEVTLSASGGDNYLWTPAPAVSNPFIDQPTTIPSSTTNYSVYINENACGFDTTINMRITVNPTPTILTQKSNDINCNTPTAQLNATGAIKYTWSGPEGLDNPSISNPEAALDSTTTFIVTGANQFGCASSAEVTINVSKTGVPRFVVPNAFTPNNDGKNDCFGIRRWGNAQIAQFAVYNRWGQIVFQTKDPSQCWDGTFNGRKQDAGGYVYVIKATTICGTVFKKGIVTLVR